MNGTVPPSIVDLIRRKRDGAVLDDDAIGRFVQGVAEDQVEDAQLGAFLMAVYLRGLDDREQAALTLAMRDSGDVLRWEGLEGPVLDKHSTGGVGDLVSLVLAPLLAACGAYVPMISGRGLGHTGGTLDKLEAIPGFDVAPPRARFVETVRAVGCAMVGQDDGLAPADRRMYAVRDVTATVSCRPLIVSSILSKKLCEGLDALVLDIKTGNGAIMGDEQAARSLGQALCDVAAAAGLACRALVTDMDQPLAPCAGNALEVRQALSFLTNEHRPERLQTVIFALASELLRLGGLAEDEAAAQRRLHRAIDDGSAAERFAQMAARQGGPADLLERATHYLAEAPVIRDVIAESGGYVTDIDTRRVGHIVRVLGGGRERAEDAIDPAVGLSALPSLGQSVAPGDRLGQVHAATQDAARDALGLLRSAITLGASPAPESSPIRGRLTPARSDKEHHP